MGRLLAYLRAHSADLRQELEAALDGDYTTNQVAGSFALGVFITSLPTLGVGVLVFFLITSLFASVSKLALFASVVVLNPIVKWGVYGTSFWIGSKLLGPVEGVSRSDVTMSATSDVVVRLLVGNFILAIVLTVLGFVFAHRLMAAYRRRNGELGPLDTAIERYREPPE